MILIILIFSFLHPQKVSGRNTKGLYVKVNIKSKRWPFPHYIVVCHGNADYLEWENVSMIYLWWMDFNLWVLQVSCSALKPLSSFYSV